MIELLKTIDTDQYLWCRDAVLVRVIGGKSALTKIGSDDTDDYTVNSVLLLNGKPIVQGEYPICPTCSALLARGYGIENTDCKELQMIRKKINSAYVDLQTSVRNIEPILDLLDDGYYMIADAEIYPTDGSHHFFANVPDKLCHIEASCSGYYNHDFLTVVDGFPAFLYPTQSNTVLNPERADYYVDKIDKDNAPRAIAYYDNGFICALLDGHHKAYAAAKKGCPLSTLVIIPMSGTYQEQHSSIAYACFSEITIPISVLTAYSRNKPQLKQIVRFDNFHNEPIAENNFDFRFYPTVEELTGIYAAGLENVTITEELVEQWIKSSDFDIDGQIKLKYLLKYYAKRTPQQAYTIAKIVVSFAPEIEKFQDLIVTAYKIIIANQNHEAEQIVLDYMINHDRKSFAWTICSSYWEDVD
ncbi:MAG: hypothetical protein K2J71_03110 [Oscillospiraceae bacterium]|nr:hypothetical protein [Oscillospiraceae bacterium]